MKRSDRTLRAGGVVRRVTVAPAGGEADVVVGTNPPVRIASEQDAAGRLVLRLADGSTIRGAAVQDGEKIWATWRGRTWCFEPAAGGAAERAGAALPADVRAPMTGTVVEVVVKVGDVVPAGAPLLTLEAMKMEHRLTAPARARVAAVKAAVGRQASDGDVLVVLEAAPPESAP
jgi:3-methylcrotonyl-CoA carboxylase alpha subunit